MYIENIVSLNQKKSKVIMDDGFAFALYNREIKKLDLNKYDHISDEFYYTEIFPILKNRAKERVAYILMSYDKTEYELRNKLKQSYYPQEVIDGVIELAKKRRYIDDSRFALRLIDIYKYKKSKRYIENKLFSKGISKDIINSLLSDIEVDEKSLILKEIERKKYDLLNMDRDEKRKIFSSFIRKGYTYESICSVMDIQSEI